MGSPNRNGSTNSDSEVSFCDLTFNTRDSPFSHSDLTISLMPKTENALVPVDFSQLPSTEISADYDALSQGNDFLSRIQLFTKGKAIDKGLIAPGHYGVPVSDDEVLDLGKEIDVLPLARRPKAMDFSDKEAIITNFDPESAEFKRIADAANGKDSGCMYGPSFLVFERSTGKFYEYYAGSKSARMESPKIAPFLPQKTETGTTQPTPMTLKARYVEKTKYPYHCPVVAKCSTPITNMDPTKAIAEIIKFVNPKSDDVEVVDEKPAGKKRAR